MTRKVVPGTKDSNGQFLPPPKTQDVVVTDVSPDVLLGRGLGAVERLLKTLTERVTKGAADRETVQGLKDCIAIIHTLKEHEKDFLENTPAEKLQLLADEEID